MTGWKVALVLVPGVVLVGAAGLAAGVRYRDELLKLVTGKEVVVVAATHESPTTEHQADDKILYICGMHPSVIRNEPGVCPICGMELTATHVHGGNMPTSTVQIDPVTVQNMGIRTAPVVEGEIRQTLRVVGTLTEPEQSHRDVNLRVSGWIQKLYANQEGMLVAEGDPLFELYSPEVTAAADELIAARKAFAGLDANADPVLKKSSETVLTAGKRKLELMGLSAAQVEAIAKLDKAPPAVTIASPMTGHIAEKMVIEGSNVKAGEDLMRIADRSLMWLQLQIYEQQLSQVKVGEKVTAKVDAFPERVFEGKIDFIYPHLDTATRTAMARVVLENPGHALHENMYATAEVEVPSMEKSMLVPREAVIDTGRRQVVFVAEGGGHFTARDVATRMSGKLAPDEPEMVQIAYGLKVGETVVTSGQFLLDSESRLEEAAQKFQRINAEGGGEPNGNEPTGGAMGGGMGNDMQGEDGK